MEDHFNEDAISDDDAQEQDLKFKAECRECIERYGNIERAKDLINTHLPDELIEPLHGEAITGQKLQEYVYGYLLTGLDNPFGFSLKGMENGIAELERLEHSADFPDEVKDLFEFAYASLQFTHKDGREYSYDINDFKHMMKIEENRLKNLESDCNTTVKSLS